MPVRVKAYHPNTVENPLTYLSADYASGTTLTVQNTNSFLPNDYFIAEILGSAECEVGQIAQITSQTSFTLVGSLQFPHPQDTTITRIDYNQYQIWRSTTGTGGTYAQLTPNQSFMVSQPLYSTVVDQQGVATYSYKVRYINTTVGSQSSFGPEMLASGYPFTSLGSIQRRVLKLYVDNNGEFIDINSITDWCNELLGRLNREVTDSESGLFATFVTFTPGNNEYTDISSYNAESILLIEYSSDGGVTYHTDTINPMDLRIKATNPTSAYSYKLADQKLFIYGDALGNTSNPTFPATYLVRMWYFTQQPVLSLQSDLLPIVYRSYSDVFVDYCMKRANEQSRRIQESATYFDKNFMDGYKSAVESVRSRINQGNKSMATTWLGSYSDW